ncbi:MAG TPA: signal peptidase II [Jatrophihabitans sp.]|jgi:signal peptidase II|nr:signal peptidase II [Jatrophihabitans sp.]
MRLASRHDEPGSGSPASRRFGLLGVAAALAGLDLAAKAWAERQLTDRIVDLGVLQLRLAHNSGVAFSMGDRLPAWTVITTTAVITTAIAGYAWKTVPATGRFTRWAWAGILAGAIANLIDRIGDGVVTDYLHTAWWPTFNLADTLLSLGVTALVLASLRRDPGPAVDPDTTVEASTRQ